jgi:hypothetical protein
MSTSWYEFPYFLSARYVIERENLLVTWKCKQLLWWWMRSSTCTSYGGGNVVMTAAVSSVFSWNFIFMETIDKVRNLRLLFNFLSVYIRDNPDCNLGVKFKVRFRWILYSQIVTTLLFCSFELEFVSFWNFENARCNYAAVLNDFSSELCDISSLVIPDSRKRNFFLYVLKLSETDTFL